MYFNLKDGSDSNLKGEVGEIIAKYHLKQSISTKQFYFGIINKSNLKPEQTLFLKENWKSLDLIELSSLTIYEVKTRKFFNHKLDSIQNKIVITPHFLSLCDKARELGFLVKVVEITFFDDWKYGIEVNDFNKDKFWVHRPRPSGWERQLKNKNTALKC